MQKRRNKNQGGKMSFRRCEYEVICESFRNMEREQRNYCREHKIDCVQRQAYKEAFSDQELESRLVKIGADDK
jgi:hypothetical protein